MTTSEALDIVRQLRELGATGVTITADGGVSAQFAPPQPGVRAPAELIAPIKREKPPHKTQDPLPTADAREAYRNKVTEMANGSS